MVICQGVVSLRSDSRVNGKPPCVFSALCIIGIGYWLDVIVCRPL